MAVRSTNCPKCQGRLSDGFVTDEYHGFKKVAHWYAGKPVSSFWTGLKLPAKSLPTTTYRCDRCGFLESYALAE